MPDTGMPETGMPDTGMSGGAPAPLADEPAPVDVISSEVVFDGYVWDVRREAFEYGGETLRRDFVDHTGAVAIFALDDDDRVLLIKQYRHPVRRREWEPPAGLLDVAEESPLDAAKRELAEEVDLEADDWHVLLDYVTTPGGNNEATASSWPGACAPPARRSPARARRPTWSRAGWRSTSSWTPCWRAGCRTPRW